MNVRILPATGHAAVENELLAQLGLPPSASPEDVDQLHEAVSEYLAAAPSSIRGWAHAQAAALDVAYLQLTDPVGLEGSALRSPTRPPTVVPGGPATPPARRGSVPPATLEDEPVLETDDMRDVEDDADDDGATDFDALYASVTPSAHEDMGPDTRVKHRPATAAPAARRRSRARRNAASLAPAPAKAGIWQRVVVGGAAIVLVAAVALGANAIVNGTQSTPGASEAAGGAAAAASPSAPTVDQAKVSQLMTQYAANPNDTATLLALADEFYAGQDYASAGDWLDKLLAIDANNVQALLARGAVSFNLGDLLAAETTWKKVVGIDANNVEVHYDLGFLYLNQQNPDWAGVQREWSLVVKLDPGSDLAQTVQSHLDALVAASMLPGPSAGSSGAPVASPAATPVASPVASPAASPAGSTQP